MTENICECEHGYGHHHFLFNKDDSPCNIKGCPCKKFEPQKQDAHSPRGVGTTLNVSERVENTQSGLRNHPDARKGNTSQTKPDLKAIDFLFILKDLINNIKKDYGNKIKYSSWSGIYDTIKSELKKKR